MEGGRGGYRGPEGELGSYTNSSHSLPFPALNQLEARNTPETQEDQIQVFALLGDLGQMV